MISNGWDAGATSVDVFVPDNLNSEKATLTVLDMELTEIPADEWDTVVKDAEEFWDELAPISPRAQRVVQIFKDYTRVMEKAGVPYRYS